MPSIRRAETFPANTPAASQIFTTVLCHGPLTCLEAARRAGLSPAAVTKAVRPLIEAGYLGPGRGRAGPPRAGSRTAALPVKPRDAQWAVTAAGASARLNRATV